MELHDFEPGPASDGPWAALIEGEGMWVLLVQDSTGTQHRVRVPAPLTPGEREDTLALAARLLDPSPSLGGGLKLPPPKVDPPPPPRPAPRPQESAEPPQPGLAGAQVPLGWVVGRSVPMVQAAAPALAEPSPPPPLTTSVRVGSAFGFRPDQDMSAGLSLDAAVGLPRVQLGVGAWWAAPAGWPLVPEGRSGGVATLAGVRVQPWRGSTVSVQAGAERRSWSLEGEPLMAHWLPTSRALVGWELSLGRVLVEPAAELRVDLARTELQLGDRALGSIAPWQVGVNLGISWQSDPKRPLEAQSR
ncbi:MAG: hypothetical protein VX899_12275 [Myxococcota bacterium]|nr:hypothetical protein [Myxococcota bacterium]